jgi:prefoldin subunit 5
MADLDNRIELLSSSRPDIVSSIDRLKKRRAELMKELSQVD